jgi:hypothetical protein
MVKVEMKKDEKTGHVYLAFESSNEADLEIVDAVRVAMMGEHPKQGGYVNSQRWVVQIEAGEHVAA